MPRVSRLAVTMALAALAAAACGRAPARAPHVSLTIATGGPGGAFYPLAVELARIYGTAVPNLQTRVETGGSGQNVQALEDGRAQIAFTQADVAYVAYRRGTETDHHPYSELRGMAVLWVNTVQIAVPGGSPIRTVADLRGRRVSVGTRGSGTETLARIVLESYGLHYDDLRPEFLSFVQTVEKMRGRQVDAAFVVAGVPADVMGELSDRPGARLIPVPREHVRTMRAQYPFLQPLVVPRGTYAGVNEDVETLGVTSLLACRQDLDASLVYRLTKALFEAMPQLSRANTAARLIDVEQAPATPIPLHPGAARYYREREIAQ